jgi:peptidoglycan hydrolase-like protein with peptidoglycan-binding domain
MRFFWFFWFLLISIILVSLPVFVFGQEIPKLSDKDIELLVSGPDLFLGSKGQEVTILQIFLARQGKVIYPDQLITGYFGQKTAAALSRFQKANSIYPSYGYFGLKTKNYIKEHKTLYVLSSYSARGSFLNKSLSGPSSLSTSSDSQIDIDTSKINVNISALGVSSKVDYLSMLIDVSKNFPAAITQDDFNKVVKSNKTPLTIPGLIEQRVNGKISQGDFVNSVIFWKKMFLYTKSSVEKKVINQKMADNHRNFIGWLDYNIKLADRLMSASTTIDDLRKHSLQYKNIFDKYEKPVYENFKLSEFDRIQFGFSWGNILSKIGLAKKANATEGFIPFGGKITVDDVCTTGALIVVSPPAEGAFFLYWSIYIANPFLYKVVQDGNWILGEALGGPGVCNKGTVSYPEGEGIIAYFGTSKEPGE